MWHFSRQRYAAFQPQVAGMAVEREIFAIGTLANRLSSRRNVI